MNRRGFLGGGFAAVAATLVAWGIKKPGVDDTLPKTYQQGWDDAMSTLSFQLEVAEAKGAGRGRSEERAALRFRGAPPMPEGWKRTSVFLERPRNLEISDYVLNPEIAEPWRLV